jgi:uncharacterized protein
VNFSRLRRPLVFLALAGALAVFAAVAVVASPVASAAAPPAAPAQDRIPPAPTRWATDEAGFLSRPALERIDARLEQYERRTGHQLLVWIGKTIGPNAVLEEWAVRAFEAWKVGRKGLDDGLVLFIFAEDRKIRIEVGYGLEGVVPDIYAYRVIDNILAPGIRAGRPDEAVDAAVTALIGYISGDAAAAGGEEREATGRDGRRGGASSTVKGVFYGIVILVLLVMFITNPSLALWLLINILSGGRGGGRGGGWGGGGGGGFSGGGGRSGGGGASGGW